MTGDGGVNAENGISSPRFKSTCRLSHFDTSFIVGLRDMLARSTSGQAEHSGQKTCDNFDLGFDRFGHFLFYKFLGFVFFRFCGFPDFVFFGFRFFGFPFSSDFTFWEFPVI